MDEKKKELARKKFTPDRGPLTEETRSLLSQKMKEWHAKTRRGVEMGNALARKARKWKGSAIWLMTSMDQGWLDGLPLMT